VLRSVAGTQASEAFDAVGHSEAVRRNMVKHAVAYLTIFRGQETLEERRERLKQQRRDDDNARLREPYAFGYHNNYEHTVPGTSSMMLSLVVSSCAYALVVSYSAQVLQMPNSANVTV